MFPPTCPTWTDGGVLTDMATAYYRERARGGVGLIIIGATHVHPSSLAAPLVTPQLFNDANIAPLAEVAKAVHAEGAKLAIQLWHSGVRGMPNPKMDPGADFDATWFTYSPSQVPLGEYPGLGDAEGDVGGGDRRDHRAPTALPRSARSPPASTASNST